METISMMLEQKLQSHVWLFYRSIVVKNTFLRI